MGGANTIIYLNSFDKKGNQKLYKLGQLLRRRFLQETKPKHSKSKIQNFKNGHLIYIIFLAIKHCSASNHNCLRTMLQLCFPLLDLQIAMHELNILDHVSLRYFGDVKAYQSTDRVDLGYH